MHDFFGGKFLNNCLFCTTAHKQHSYFVSSITVSVIVQLISHMQSCTVKTVFKTGKNYHMKTSAYQYMYLSTIYVSTGVNFFVCCGLKIIFSKRDPGEKVLLSSPNTKGSNTFFCFPFFHDRGFTGTREEISKKKNYASKLMWVTNPRE